MAETSCLGGKYANAVHPPGRTACRIPSWSITLGECSISSMPGQNGHRDNANEIAAQDDATRHSQVTRIPQPQDDKSPGQYRDQPTHQGIGGRHSGAESPSAFQTVDHCAPHFIEHRRQPRWHDRGGIVDHIRCRVKWASCGRLISPSEGLILRYDVDRHIVLGIQSGSMMRCRNWRVRSFEGVSSTSAGAPCSTTTPPSRKTT